MMQKTDKYTLIGHTGFVGSNLIKQIKIAELYNSQNIAEIGNKKHDIVLCAGIRAKKWFANQEPENDLANIEILKKYLRPLKLNRFILISTIDVYDHPRQVDEDNLPNIDQQDYYGKHRYQFEQWVSQHFTNYNIIRLPALFGENLQKNLIFDILHPIAKTINKNLWLEISNKMDISDAKKILNFYQQDAYGNLHLLNTISNQTTQTLATLFKKADFSALNFTDCRSSFQFYNLNNLWQDIQFAINNNIKLLNIVSEPIVAQELIQFVLQSEFKNQTIKGPVVYDVFSKYASQGNYFYTKTEMLNQIKSFMEKQLN